MCVFRSHPPGPGVFILNERSAGFANRRADRLPIDWIEAAQIDHLRPYAGLFFYFLGRDERPVDRRAVGYDGHVRALARYSRLAERNHVIGSRIDPFVVRLPIEGLI